MQLQQGDRREWVRQQVGAAIILVEEHPSWAVVLSNLGGTDGLLDELAARAARCGVRLEPVARADERGYDLVVRGA